MKAISSKRARKLRRHGNANVQFSHTNHKGTAFYIWEKKATLPDTKKTKI